MFEKLINDIESNQKESPMVKIDLSKNPLVNKDFFRDRIQEIDIIQDKDLYDLVKESHKSILEDIMNRNDAQYIDAFTNPRFLSALIQVLRDTTLEYDERVCCNKLAYDYITLKNNDDYIKQLFYSLSKIVNRDKIPSLVAIGLPENLATYIALARYSSTKEIINMKRMNFILTTSPIELMTEQVIVHIYEVLVDRFTPLFVGTMFDVYDEDGPDEDWITDDIMEIYSTVSNAVLFILNNMTSDKIRQVLISYAGDYQALYSDKPNSYRFSMKCISGDFERIRNVLEALKLEGVIIP